MDLLIVVLERGSSVEAFRSQRVLKCHDGKSNGSVGVYLDMTGGWLRGFASAVSASQ